MFDILLLLGLTAAPDVPAVSGKCYWLEPSPVDCVMVQKPYGTRLVYTKESVYSFRPVWWGVYTINKDGATQGSDRCNYKGSDIVCLKTFSFISDK
jgi:hypothetical protein